MSILTEGGEFQNIVRSYAVQILRYKYSGVRNTVYNSIANTAEGANLERIGRDRNLPRYQLEDIDEYRARVVDAYNKNLGLGDVENIIRAMEGLGASTLGVQYQFNSHTSGDKGDSTTGLFNLLIESLGGFQYDATKKYDGSIKYDTPSDNDIVIEIVQPTAISNAQALEIRNELDPIIRASSQIIKIVQLTP